MLANILKSTFVIFVWTTILSACEHESDDVNISNLLEQDLTGTWLVNTAAEVYDVSSGDYLHTFFEARVYIFQDSGQFIEVSQCSNFGEIDSLGTKTTDSFDFDSFGEVVFTRTENGQLVRVIEYEVPYNPDLFVKQRGTLSKISNNITTDNGALELIGPISVVEDNNVCVAQNIFSTGDNSTYYIIVPFDTGNISLQFTVKAPFAVGHHEFVKFSDVGVFSGFGISSSSDEFLLTVGTDSLFPDFADIEITDVSSDNIGGNFSFIGIDGGNYSGTFQLAPLDNPL